MYNNNILVGAIQETKLSEKSKALTTNNYTLVRQDRGTDKGGGLAFLVHNDINFYSNPTPANLINDPHIETQTITIPGKDFNLQIRNTYIPPTASCSALYSPNIDALFEDLNETSILIGDVNAHHSSWFSEDEDDARGRALVDAIDALDFGILNEDTPTRVTAQSCTAPDLTIVSSKLLPVTNWKTEIKSSSDHLPITISIIAEINKQKSQHNTYINFAKADWTGFTEYTEKIFNRAKTVTNVYDSEKYFRNKIIKAANKFIPKGRILHPISNIPTEAAILIEERDNIRAQNPSDQRIPDLNKQINTMISDHKREKWREHLNKCQSGSKNLWNTIKKLNNPTQQPKNQGIDFNGKIFIDPKKIAHKFNQQYTPGLSSKPKKQARSTRRNLKKKPQSNSVKITTQQVAEAIKKSKSSKALGPDGISPIMIKHLGPNGIKVLTNIYNLSVNNSHIPSVWKTGRIIPLIKPGKPSDKGPSFRPISLLSPLAKILESVLLPLISQAVVLEDHQHGFRKGKSTTTALHTINEHITNGLNSKIPANRTISVAIDLSRAFDTVDHDLLLKDINELDLNDNIKRFICAYLRGRQTYVEFRGAKSQYRKVKQGVPQGGVLSPLLFNLYMSKMPKPPGKILLVSYADDSNVLNSGPNIMPLCEELNPYLNTLNNWFISRNLFISPAKSTATLFTTSPNEVSTELNIKIQDQIVPTVKKPKFLGIVYDNLFTFSQHANDMKSKLHKKNNVLKALAGSTWGKDKETLTSTYKAIGQSTTNYACPIWTPSLSNSAWDKLQTAQNQSLKTALGCHKIASMEHVHNETKIMPVRAHCEMLSKQYLVSTQLDSHPVKIDLYSPPPARNMKQTLKSKFGRYVRKLIPRDEHLDKDKYKKKIKIIHTKEVQENIKNLGNNPVLNAPPPEINICERNLPRTTRSTLSQLRSSHSIFLNTYKSRLDPTVNKKCPDCNIGLHTTAHLFKCKAKPTSLNVRALWNAPSDAARFLGLPHEEPYDDHG